MAEDHKDLKAAIQCTTEGNKSRVANQKRTSKSRQKEFVIQEILDSRTVGVVRNVDGIVFTVVRRQNPCIENVLHYQLPLNLIVPFHRRKRLGTG